MTWPADISRYYKYAVYLLFICLSVLILITFNDYGISTDEAIRNAYGIAIFEFYQSGFTDTRVQHMGAASYYGGFFDTLCAIVNHYTSFDEFATRHLLGAVIGLYGIYGCYRLATFLAGHVAGFYSALFLAITPLFYAHLFMNPKDLPFASFYIWTLYYGIQCLHEIEKPKLGNIVLLGIHFGILLAIKVVGAIVSVYLLLGFVLVVICSAHTQSNRALFGAGLKVSLIAFGLAYLIMLLFWPWAWIAPLSNPLAAALEFSRFSNWQGQVLLFGELYAHKQIPVLYLPVHYLLQLPEIFLIFILFSICLLCQQLIFKQCSSNIVCQITDKRKKIDWLILAVAAFLPIILAMALQSTVYNGIRHFLFTLPVMAVFAGYGAAVLSRYFSSRNRHWYFGSFAGTLALYLIYQVSQMIALHPYQYTYYNRIAGGTAGAFHQFELEYWSTSYREAVQKLQTYLDSKNKNYPVKVFIVGTELPALHYFSEQMQLTRERDQADYIISNVRYQGLDMPKQKPLLVVSRMNTAFTYVFRQNATN